LKVGLLCGTTTHAVSEMRDAPPELVSVQHPEDARTNQRAWGSEPHSSAPEREAPFIGRGFSSPSSILPHLVQNRMESVDEMSPSGPIVSLHSPSIPARNPSKITACSKSLTFTSKMALHAAEKSTKGKSSSLSRGYSCPNAEASHMMNSRTGSLDEMPASMAGPITSSLTVSTARNHSNLSVFRERFASMAMVVSAEHPLQKYHEMKERAMEVEMSNASMVETMADVNHGDVESKADALVDQRNTSGKSLEQRIQRIVTSGTRQNLLRRIERKLDQNFDSAIDRLNNEMLITGQMMFDLFTPASIGNHTPFFTCFFFFFNCMVFSYMCGQYPFWRLKDQPHNTSAVMDEYTTDPSGWNKFIGDANENEAQQLYSFSFQYLLTWGSRYLPAMAHGQSWRWVTSLFIHENYNHLLSNMGLFLPLSYTMECKYGTVHLAPLALLAGLGGNLTSALFEDPCLGVMGASGIVFGIFGLYMADLVLNFETVKRPLLQGIAIFIFLVYFFHTLVSNESGSSHISHIGGLLCGLFPAILMLPNFKKEDWEAKLPFIAFAVFIVFFVIFPILIYQTVVPEMDCAQSG